MTVSVFCPQAWINVSYYEMVSARKWLDANVSCCLGEAVVLCWNMAQRLQWRNWLHTFYVCLVYASFKLTNLIHVVHGTIHMELKKKKKDLSLAIHCQVCFPKSMGETRQGVASVFSAADQWASTNTITGQIPEVGISRIHASHKQVLTFKSQASPKLLWSKSSKSSRVMAKVKQVTRNLYECILHICRHSKQKRVVR